MNASGRVVLSASAFLAVFLLAALTSLAQMRPATMAPLHPAMHPIAVRPAATPAVPVPRARINTVVPAPRSVQPVRARVFSARARLDNIFIGGSGETLQQLLDPVPGPGFDYAHVAALDRDLDIKAVIDPATQWRLAVAERVLRDTATASARGYYLLDGGAAYAVPTEEAPAEQPQESRPPEVPEVIVVQQPAQTPAAESASATSQRPQAPVPDVGNFTLVMRNGKTIQAVAFTRTGDRIAYIAADGERHTIAATELDAAATERLNRESGKQLTL
ncbi:MAG: hypothetical protein KGL02_10770 [Acidobacteriota bacterium]|nr:hypothetical protein [Acidobacteriota bacterium]